MYFSLHWLHPYYVDFISAIGLCNFSPWASSAMEVATETKFGTSVVWGEDDARMSNTRTVQRKRAMPHWTMKNNMHNIRERRIDRTCIVVTVLCNQPEALTSDLVDNQSHYLFLNFRCDAANI